MTQTITPSVSLNILSELPRFFGSKAAALREIIQNSVRAGATQITIEEQDSRLTFSDNGHGLQNPQVLLTVAQSEWKDVIDPAGIGILSILNPAWTKAVTFQSSNWSFHLTPEDFMQAKPTEVQVSPPVGGFRLSIERKEGQLQFTQAELLEARAYAPIELNIGHETLPPLTPSGIHMRIPEGDLYFITSYNVPEYLLSPSYWEGFPTTSSLKKTLLKQELSHKEKAILSSSRLTFFPSKDSGILPKLPDRNAFIENEAWLSGAKHTLNLLNEKADQELAKIDLSAKVINLSELYSRMFAKRTQGNLWDTTSMQDILEGHLQDLGYLTYSLCSSGSFIEFIMDGDESSLQKTTTLAFHPSLCPNREIHEGSTVLTLQSLGRSVPGLPFGTGPLKTEEPPSVTRTVTRKAGFLQLCSELEFGGIAVPWFVEDGKVLLKGSPEEAEKTYQEHKADICTALLQSIYESDFPNEALGVYENCNYRPQNLIPLIENDFETLFPERLQLKTTLLELEEKALTIARIISNIKKIPEISQLVPEEMLQSFKQQQQAIESQIDTLKRK